MATTHPDRLHYTGVDEADELLAREPFALLVGFALDQQVPVQTAFSGPLKLKQRLGTLEPGKIAATDPGRLQEVFREKPAIHRFPGNMAKRVQDLAVVVVEDYGGDAATVWTGAKNGADLFKRVQALPGYGKQKAQILVALLGKQFDVQPQGWRAAAGDYGKAGSTLSAADIVDDASLLRVRAHKKELKAAAKAAKESAE